MMHLGIAIGKRHHDAALFEADGTVIRQLRFPTPKAGAAQTTRASSDLAREIGTSAGRHRGRRRERLIAL